MTSNKSGQPLRFMALLMIAWITLRIAAQPGPSPLSPLPLMDGRTATAAMAPRQTIPVAVAKATEESHREPVSRFRKANSVTAISLPSIDKTGRSAVDVMPIKRPPTTANRSLDIISPYPPPQSLGLPVQSPPSSDHWRGSSWMLWRDGGMRRADIARTGRLGGSQIGARLDYVLNPAAAHRATAYARMSTALDSPAAPEVAVGLAIQPLRALPVNFAIERRIAIDTGGRNAMAVMAVGGFGPTPVAFGLQAEAYAQAGIVGFRERDAFIDGKLSLFAPVPNTALRMGGALSGGAQPSADRLDIGPEVQIRLPLRPMNARLSIEWRERIGGRAAPASGLALTLGADF